MQEIIKENFEILMPFLEKMNLNFFSNNDSSKEIELKVKVNDDIFKKLYEAGFLYVKTVYERNFLYDFKEENLKKANSICRIRRERNLGNGVQDIILTLKKNIKSDDIYKEEIELETHISEDKLEALDDALNDSNLGSVFVYEKFRHVFSINDMDVVLLVDVLPLIGRFIEVEGSKEEIQKVLSLLNIQNDDTQKSNYMALLKSHARGDGREYRFSKYDSFLIAQKEIMMISECWPMNESSCSHSCSCCSHSCSGCHEE